MTVLNCDELGNIFPKISRAQFNGFGVDLTLSGEFRDVAGNMLSLEEVHLKPLTTLLASTEELLDIPPYCVGLFFGRSTLARLGLVANTTVFEPGWRGNATINLINLGGFVITLSKGDRIGQLLLFRGSTSTKTYKGHYQDARGIQVSREMEK